MSEQILIDYRGALIVIMVALVGVLAALRIRRKDHDNIEVEEVHGIFSDAITALKNPDKIGKDAFDILAPRFEIHHTLFILVYNQSSFIRKCRLKKAWKEYYGKDGKQEWWLPNEYSAIQTNQIKNTLRNTKELAIHRINNFNKLLK